MSQPPGYGYGYSPGPHPPYGAQPVPAPDPRPGTVTAAGVITVMLGVLGMFGTLAIGGLVVALGFFLDALADSKGGGGQDRVSGWAIGIAVVLVAVGLLLSTLHLLLGVRVMRGGAVARVVLTVWDALAALAGGALLVASLLPPLEDGPSGALSLLWLVLLGFGVLVAVLVCLWNPASNAWFARVAAKA